MMKKKPMTADSVGGHHWHMPETVKSTPKPHEVLVELKACGFCHTDIHAIIGDWEAKPKVPLIPGHEGVGIVVEVTHRVLSSCYVVRPFSCLFSLVPT
jgi:D-arabinose 1-dehydrogenase-like Zn-dependent alcohol dehydrogenase